MVESVDGRSQLRAMIVPTFATSVFGGVWLFFAGSAIKDIQGVVLGIYILIGIATVALLINAIRFARQARRV